MTALALREDQDYWDEKQLAVLQQTGIGEQVTKAEMAAFLHLCQRTGLDPFARQIYLIGRWDKRAGREVFRPQTGIDGYRIVAQRTVERTRQSFGYEDTLWCGTDGQWTDVWLSPDPPAAAKVTVLRDGKRFPAIARWSEYVPLDRDGNPTGLWVKRHAAQLEKCAEALALRKAFPNDMAGVYTSEEMEQADNPAQPIRGTAERISEERAALPADDTWHVNPVPENPWLAAALEQAPKHATLDACTAVWRKSSEKVHAGELSEAEAGRLQALLRKRMEELRITASAETAAPAAEPVPAKPIEGVVVPDLPDDWRDKVTGILTGDDADTVITEAQGMLGDETLTPELFAAISTAVTARLQEIDAGQGVLV